jgi:4-amino-4-deoxy-L-arabinose transferase-like glycosyltransferase
MGRRLFGERAGWIAALAAAVHPPFLGFAALIQTALFEIFWTTLALYFALRAGDAGGASARSAFLAGLAAAVAGLTRPPALAILAVAPFAWRAGGLPWRASARRAAAMLLGSALLLVPWVARNHHVRGAWVLVSSNGGWNLFVGNNPAGAVDRADLAHAVPPDLRERLMWMNEVEGDRALRRLALDYMRAHPAEAARRVLARAKTLVWFNEEFGKSSGYSGVLQRLTRGVYRASWAILLPLAIAGMILTRRDARRHLLLYGVIAANAAVILATFFVNRYRAPIEPILILFAAAAADRGWRNSKINTALLERPP